MTEDITKLDALRIRINEHDILHREKAGEFFDFLPNNTDLTEEYLYAHQPTTQQTINVYATNRTPIGALDDTNHLREHFSVLQGPVIVVARKGYAGRLFVVEDEWLIIHEDAYAIEPKSEYREKIDLHWFANHYSFEFQANRTSLWGIGDFPREKLRAMLILVPKIEVQKRLAQAYQRRNEVLEKVAAYRGKKEREISDWIGQSQNAG